MVEAADESSIMCARPLSNWKLMLIPRTQGTKHLTHPCLTTRLYDVEDLALDFESAHDLDAAALSLS